MANRRVGKAGINWRYDTLTPTMAAFTVRSNVAVNAGAAALARRIESYMKANRPWEDRTGAARAGLGTSVQHQGFRVVISLFHGVDYGLWLEVRWNGRYAIIIPTLEHFDESSETWNFFSRTLNVRGKG